MDILAADKFTAKVSQANSAEEKSADLVVVLGK